MGEVTTCEQHVLAELGRLQGENDHLRWKVRDLERQLDELRGRVPEDGAPHTCPDAAPCRFCGHEPLVEVSRTRGSARVWCANVTCVKNPSVRGRGRDDVIYAWNLIMGGDDDA